jgi:hypothetical protein
MSTELGEARLVEMLSALVACDGRPVHAQRRLKAQGVDVKWTELRDLREQHAAMYQALAVEHSRATEEALAVEYRELARLGQRATRNFIEGLLEYQETTPNSVLMEDKTVPQIIQALAKVQQVSTDKLLALTGRPTDGGSSDPLEAARKLVELGVLQPVQRPSIEGTAEEVS